MAAMSKCPCPHPVEWLKGKVIGSGSFGTVHLAMDKATGGLFVVKSAESEAGIRCLENECQILETLDSPHIVKCIGKDVSLGANGTRKHSVFIEYMAGGSLADIAEKFGGVFDEKIISLYIKGILQGLKYLHENGIVHCDLKCRNVLLGSCGEIKLADFGLSTKNKEDMSVKSGSNTKPLSIISGTPLWMAPERLRNEELDFASDIWSLGCTILEMATGKPPWGGVISNPMAAIFKIAYSNEVPQFPSHLSDGCLDFLAKCLDRDAKKRWTAENLLEHAFVSRKPEDKSLVKRDVCSPASVLDMGIFSEMVFSSDDESCEEEDDFKSKNPFAVRFHHKMLDETEGGVENDLFESSESWINVRTN